MESPYKYALSVEGLEQAIKDLHAQTKGAKIVLSHNHTYILPPNKPGHHWELSKRDGEVYATEVPTL